MMRKKIININKSVKEITKENQEIVIKAIRKECGDNYDELLNCR